MNAKNAENSLSRRQLLEGAGILSGALVLGRAAQSAEGATQETKTESDFVLKLADAPELGNVGGWKVIEIGADKVIVANTPDGLVACSAICTHKGCEVEYQSEKRQFACPCHGARFGEDGTVARGPARLPLVPYVATQALLIAKK